jgi:hypothetical protein
MTNYLKTREVLKRLRIEIFELFDLCKNGELQAYNKYGKRLANPDLCEKGKKDTLDEILRLVHLEDGAKATGHVIGSGRRNIEEPLLTQKEIERKARKQYNAQPDESPIIPEDCVPFDFSFPARPSEFQTLRDVQKKSKQKIKDAETFRFKKSDVKKLEIECGIEDKPKSKQFEDLTASNSKNKKTVQGFDAFIRELTIIPESDYEINIKEKRKKAVPYSHTRLGFFKKGTYWYDFLEIIRVGGFYNVGPSSAKKEYDKKQTCRKEINKKLIDTFRKEFSLQIPDKFQFFELVHSEGRGVYKLKIPIESHTKDDSKYKHCTREELLGFLLPVTKDYISCPQHNYLKGKINTIKLELIESHGMTEEEIEKEITDYVYPKTDKEEIEEAFSNHVCEEPIVPEPNY